MKKYFVKYNMCTRACKIVDQYTDLSQNLLFPYKKNHKTPAADLKTIKALEADPNCRPKKRVRLYCKGADSPTSTDSETESAFDSQASTLALGEGHFVGRMQMVG